MPYSTNEHHLYQIYIGGAKEKLRKFYYCKDCDHVYNTPNPDTLIHNPDQKTSVLSLETKGRS